MMMKQLSMIVVEMNMVKRKDVERMIQFNNCKKKVYNTMKDLEVESEFSYQCIIAQNLLQKMEDLVIEGN